MNKSAGSRPFDSGLVIQSRPQIDTNEAGLMETTFSFLTAISNWPTKQPPRGTPCNQFLYGDTVTRDFLAGVSFLACQTAKWKPGPLSEPTRPGTLEVLCQGAIFNVAISGAPVASVDIADRGEYTVRPNIVFSGGGVITAAQANVYLSVKTFTLFAAGTSYTAGDILTATGGAYYGSHPVKIRVDTVSAGAIATFHYLDPGLYSTIPTGHVSFTGGTGSGAQFDLTWQIGVISMLVGGSYLGTPGAELSGGTFTIEGVLGAVHMDTRQVIAGNEVTAPNATFTTVKDTVEIPVYEASPGGVGTVIAAYACTQSLPPYTHGTYSGYDGIRANANGPLPLIDGLSLGAGMVILLDDGTPFAGVYRIVNPGAADYGIPGTGSPWTLVRVREMDQSSEVTNTLKINVAAGSANAGLWQCTVTGSFTLNTDPITFAKQTATAKNVPAYKVTIDYRAIELNFEYMAKTFAHFPRWLQDEYTLTSDGQIVINNATGAYMLLQIDNVRAIKVIATDDGSGNITLTDGPEVPANPGLSVLTDGGQRISLRPPPFASTDGSVIWQNSVKFIGAEAQFEQSTAGAAWHVKETTTIKIVPIIPAGDAATHD